VALIVDAAVTLAVEEALDDVQIVPVEWRYRGVRQLPALRKADPEEEIVDPSDVRRDQVVLRAGPPYVWRYPEELLDLVY
jgi:hypothetical protein